MVKLKQISLAPHEIATNTTMWLMPAHGIAFSIRHEQKTQLLANRSFIYIINWWLVCVYAWPWYVLVSLRYKSKRMNTLDCYFHCYLIFIFMEFSESVWERERKQQINLFMKIKWRTHATIANLAICPLVFSADVQKYAYLIQISISSVFSCALDFEWFNILLLLFYSRATEWVTTSFAFIAILILYHTTTFDMHVRLI